MRNHAYLLMLLLLPLALAGCISSSSSQLEATNAALSEQLKALQAQLTQQAVLPLVSNQGQSNSSAPTPLPTAIPLSGPSILPTESSNIINSALIYSGSGTITPWTNQTLYANALFGASNVHMICDPNGTADGKMWIDKETEIATCGAKGEGWSPWKQDITIGDHYIYSANANDKYEFWTIGSTPFTIRNTYSHSDFIFTVNDPGIYTLKANLIKGEFNVYLTCQEAQNFNYKITQSTSIPIVMNPAACLITIRDVNQAKTSHADIEVSFEFTK